MSFIKDVLLSTGEKKELKSSIDYHLGYLDQAGGRVVANDFDYLNGTHSQAQFQASKFGNPLQNSTQQEAQKEGLGETLRTAATAENGSPDTQHHNLPLESELLGQPDAGRLQSTSNITILDSRERLDLAKSLLLPENLWPVWRVENRLYDIYFIPGYDNWLYERIKSNPNELHRVSDYKRSFFENMLRVQNPDLYEKYIRDKQDKPAPLPNMYGSALHKTQSINFNGTAASTLPGINPYGGRGQTNTSGYHPAKREYFHRDGHLVSTHPDQKLATGTEFWQTSYQNANQLSAAGNGQTDTPTQAGADEKSRMTQTLYGKDSK